jgi:hypothetical protein
MLEVLEINQESIKRGKKIEKRAKNQEKDKKY